VRNKNQNPATEVHEGEGVQVKSRRKVLYIGAAAMVLAVVLVVFFTIANSYRGRFLNHTTINGVNCSGKTVEEVNSALNEQAQNYSLKLKEREGQEETITGKEINLTYADQGEVQKLLDDVSPYAWIGALFRDTDLTTGQNLSYDETALKEALENLRAFNPAYEQAPTDACLVKGEDVFTIQKESQGYKLDEDKTVKAIDQAIQNGTAELDLDESGCYEAPSVYSDDAGLQTQLNKVNGYLNAKITYDFEDRTIPVGKEDIMNMIAEQDDHTYILDPDLVLEFVKTKLAYKTDTFGLSRTVTTHSGKKITLKGGDYGWCINRSETAEELIQHIEGAEEKTLEPVYSYSGKSRATNDLGGTYVEISIAAQTLWCYKDGKVIVETPVVTGNPARGNSTPAGGVWAIDAKKSPATLGTMETMGYSSDVTYWMPFNGNVGMHDADGWRSQYGGEIYKTNGSHGCVNMPSAAARTVYATVEIGTAVVVY
jgi:hypothetical protein